VSPLLGLLGVLLVGFVKGTPHQSPVTLDDDFQRIRCPACQWRPGRHDLWSCVPGCGHVWNTFETRGMCPNCSKQWTHTSCHRCDQWSPHDDWYERPEGSQSDT
jgi:hypothetical protein